MEPMIVIFYIYFSITVIKIKTLIQTKQNIYSKVMHINKIINDKCTENYESQTYAYTKSSKFTKR